MQLLRNCLVTDERNHYYLLTQVSSTVTILLLPASADSVEACLTASNNCYWSVDAASNPLDRMQALYKSLLLFGVLYYARIEVTSYEIDSGISLRVLSSRRRVPPLIWDFDRLLYLKISQSSWRLKRIGYKTRVVKMRHNPARERCETNRHLLAPTHVPVIPNYSR